MRTSESEDWGLDFSDVGGDAATPVTDANKRVFVRRKVGQVLVACRRGALEALRNGFVEALGDLSAEAAPFLKLFSSTDWRVLLCADDDRLAPGAVLAALEFVGFSSTSAVPRAIEETFRTFDRDSLRRFLVFATGSPSLPVADSFKIQIRRQPPSAALPVAHTCFFFIDVPDYPDEAECAAKFATAMLECGTFDRV